MWSSALSYVPLGVLFGPNSTTCVRSSKDPLTAVLEKEKRQKVEDEKKQAREYHGLSAARLSYSCSQCPVNLTG